MILDKTNLEHLERLERPRHLAALVIAVLCWIALGLHPAFSAEPADKDIQLLRMERAYVQERMVNLEREYRDLVDRRKVLDERLKAIESQTTRAKDQKGN